MALLIHGYYIAGVTNFSDFTAEAKVPMYVKGSSALDVWA